MKDLNKKQTVNKQKCANPTNFSLFLQVPTNYSRLMFLSKQRESANVHEQKKYDIETIGGIIRNFLPQFSRVVR